MNRCEEFKDTSFFTEFEQMMDVFRQSVIFTDQTLSKPPVETFTNTTVLSRAITAGTIKEVKLLLEDGCDPNQPCGIWGMRPLMIAQYASGRERRQKIMQLLLQFGGIPSLTDNNRRNCLMYACIVQSCESVSKMLQVAEYNLYDTDCDGNTLLHLSAMVGNADILKTILKYGTRYRCDLNSRNKLSLTALMVAILRQRRECTVLLHEHGATPRFTAYDFQSILSMMEGKKDMKVSDKYDLLLRIISDSESVSKKANILVQCHKTMQILTPEKLEADQKQQAAATDPVHYDSPNEDYGKTRNIGHRANTFSNSKSKFDGQSSVVGVDLTRRSISLQSELRSPSYMASIEDILARLYHTRRSASYCNPRANKHEVNKEWVDTIRKYQDEQSKCNTAPTEGIVKISSRLARTTSSPSSSDGLPAAACPTPPRARPRSLSRSTTSPNLFSQYCSARRKPKTSSPIEQNLSAETP